MTVLFLQILSMSLTASAVVLAVILARIPLRRAPKKISYWLWLAVAFRLCCPVSWNSPLSLFTLVPLPPEQGAMAVVGETEDVPTEEVLVPAIADQPADPLPEAEPAFPLPAGTSYSTSAPVPEQAGDPQTPQAAEPLTPAPVAGTGALPGDSLPAQTTPVGGDAAIPGGPSSENAGESVPHPTEDPAESPASGTDASVPAPEADAPVVHRVDAGADPRTDARADVRAVSPSVLVLRVLSLCWAAGVAVLLIYAVASYLRIRRAMATAVLLEPGVYQSERIRSPFLMGLVRPRIYLPYGTEGDMLRYVLAHERYHIRRHDSAAKCFAFLLLAIHWFNPLVWLAFRLMSRDMEMSCDECVLASEEGIQKRYSYSLLSFASGERFPSPSPLAFGETDVKSRIKNVLNWKRPKIWVTALSILLGAAVAVLCMANPVEPEKPGPEDIPPVDESGAGTDEESAETEPSKPEGPDGGAEEPQQSYRFLTPMPSAPLVPMAGETLEILYHHDGYPQPIGGWSHWGTTAEGHDVWVTASFASPEMEQETLHWDAYDKTDGRYLFYLSGDLAFEGDGRFRASVHPVNDYTPDDFREVVFSVEIAEGFPYGAGDEEETLVFTLLEDEDDLLAPFLGVRVPFANCDRRPSEPLTEEELAENDALHARGLFTRRETELVTEQLVGICMTPDWLEGDVRSAVFMYNTIGRMRSEYGKEYPAVFRSMMRVHDGNYAVSGENLRRLAVEFAGIPEEDFSPAEIREYDPATDEAFVVPMGYGPSGYSLRGLEIRVEEDATVAYFSLYRLTRDMEEPAYIGEYQISYTASGDGRLPRMRFSSALPEDPPIGEDFASSLVVPDFLNAEQRSLFIRAEKVFPAFCGNPETLSLPSSDAAPETLPEVAGYLPLGGRYARYADLEAMLCSVFTEEYFAFLNGTGTSMPLYIDADGWTCYLSVGMGGEESIVEYELMESTPDRVSFWQINRFANTRPASDATGYEIWRDRIEMVNTADGWRVERFVRRSDGYAPRMDGEEAEYLGTEYLYPEPDPENPLAPRYIVKPLEPLGTIMGSEPNFYARRLAEGTGTIYRYLLAVLEGMSDEGTSYRQTVNAETGEMSLLTFEEIPGFALVLNQLADPEIQPVRAENFVWQGQDYFLPRPFALFAEPFQLVRPDDGVAFGNISEPGTSTDKEQRFVFLTDKGVFWLENTPDVTGETLFVESGGDALRYTRSSVAVERATGDAAAMADLRYNHASDLWMETGAIRFAEDGAPEFVPTRTLSVGDWFNAAAQAGDGTPDPYALMRYHRDLTLDLDDEINGIIAEFGEITVALGNAAGEEADDLLARREEVSEQYESLTYAKRRFSDALNAEFEQWVERTAAESSREEIEAEIRRLEGQRTVASIDMDNASARIREYDAEIAECREILDSDTASGEDKRVAQYRLDRAEELREQQAALEGRCLRVIKQFGWEIDWQGAVLARMQEMELAAQEPTVEEVVTLSPLFTGLNGRQFSPFSVDLPKSWENISSYEIIDGDYPRIDFFAGPGPLDDRSNLVFSWVIAQDLISWDGTELPYHYYDYICYFEGPDGRMDRLQFALTDPDLWITADGDARTMIESYPAMLDSLRPNRGYKVVDAAPRFAVRRYLEGYAEAVSALPLSDGETQTVNLTAPAPSGNAVPVVSLRLPAGGTWADNVRIERTTDPENGAAFYRFLPKDRSGTLCTLEIRRIPWEQAAGPHRLPENARLLRTAEVNDGGEFVHYRVSVSWPTTFWQLTPDPPFWPSEITGEVLCSYLLCEGALSGIDAPVSDPAPTETARTGFVPGNIANGGTLASDGYGTVYFVNPADGNLWRSDADGTHLRLLAEERVKNLNVLDGWIYYTDVDGRQIRRIPTEGGEAEILWEVPRDGRYANSILRLNAASDWLWFDTRIDAELAIWRMRPDGSEYEVVFENCAFCGWDGGYVFGVRDGMLLRLNPETRAANIVRGDLGGAFTEVIVDASGIAFLQYGPDYRLIVLDRLSWEEKLNLPGASLWHWSNGRLSAMRYGGKNNDYLTVEQTDTETWETVALLRLHEELYDFAGNPAGITFAEFRDPDKTNALREAHPELVGADGVLNVLTEWPETLASANGQLCALAKTREGLLATGLSVNWILCDGEDGTLAFEWPGTVARLRN